LQSFGSGDAWHYANHSVLGGQLYLQSRVDRPSAGFGSRSNVALSMVTSCHYRAK